VDRLENENGRASYNGSSRTVKVTNTDKASITLHEMGHHLEKNNPMVGKAARRFLSKRTSSETAKSDRFYNKSEKFKKDNFIDSYMGRIYKSGSTEIISMGLEMFYDNPLKLAKKDPEYFNFIFALMRGVDIS